MIHQIILLKRGLPQKPVALCTRKPYPDNGYYSWADWYKIDCPICIKTKHEVNQRGFKPEEYDAALTELAPYMSGRKELTATDIIHL